MEDAAASTGDVAPARTTGDAASTTADGSPAMGDPAAPTPPVALPPYRRPSDQELYGHDHARHPTSSSVPTPPSIEPRAEDRPDFVQVLLTRALDVLPVHPAWTIASLLTAGYCHLTWWGTMAAFAVWPYYAGSALANEIGRPRRQDSQAQHAGPSSSRAGDLHDDRPGTSGECTSPDVESDPEPDQVDL